jgi:hypothetical protein
VVEVLFTKLTGLQQPQAELVEVEVLVYNTETLVSLVLTILMVLAAAWH